MKRLSDGDLIKLKSCENSAFAEFLHTKNREPAWRLYSRLGYGILLTYEEMKVFYEYLKESLDESYLDRGEENG